ncbi:hypothetical protein [Sodalis sp.]|uniref:hypothetical protein n=1 Tax=Sodalis sp. (in: enterobacteria) TaxID=1898979 RepID=UPI003872FAF3
MNWRLAGPLTLRCPGMPRLVLAFAVTDMAAGASAPLPLFRQLLQDEAAGSLLDNLRVRGLCDGVRLLPCYQNADQGIVALEFSLLPGGVTRKGEIAALRELPPRSLRHYAGLADAALARLAPMQQLRARAEALIPPATPALSSQACPSAPWARWLAQLDVRAPLQLSIAADLPGRTVISQGFSLRLGADGATPSAPPFGAPSGHSHATAAGLKTESPPPPDPAFRFFSFPAPKAPDLQPDRAVRLRYRPAPRRRAVLLLRPQTAGHWDERLVYGMQCALRPAAGALAHRGGLLSFQPEAGRWTLLLSATPAQMPTALAHTIDRLRSLTAYDIQQGLWRRQAHRQHMEAEIPARALLHALSLWLNAPFAFAGGR